MIGHVELTIHQLYVDTDNYRMYYDGIERLAESIYQHGLLQNLIVYPRVDESEKYIVKAGNRRVLAINKLLDEGRWPADEKILCLIYDESADNPWIPLVENIQREDVPPWRLGFRYMEIIDTGITQSAVAGYLNVCPGTVSNAINIARGLHPAIISRLEKLGHRILNKPQYIALSRVIDDEGNPNEKAQMEMLEGFLAVSSKKRERKPPVRRKQKDLAWTRLHRLISGKAKIPPHAQPYVTAVARYINGDDKVLKLPPKADLDALRNAPASIDEYTD